jgi:hypothetical protein
VFGDQPGRYYFMSGYKIDILGITFEYDAKQINLLMPEGHWSGTKGIEVVQKGLVQIKTSPQFAIS